MFNWMFLSVQKHILFLCQRVNTAAVMATCFALRYAMRLIVFGFWSCKKCLGGQQIQYAEYAKNLAKYSFGKSDPFAIRQHPSTLCQFKACQIRWTRNWIKKATFLLFFFGKSPNTKKQASLVCPQKTSSIEAKKKEYINRYWGRNGVFFFLLCESLTSRNSQGIPPWALK